MPKPKQRPAEESKLYKYCRANGVNPADINMLMKQEGVLPIGKDRLSNFASGKSGLQMDAIFRLCRTLRCAPNDILDYEEYTK